MSNFTFKPLSKKQEEDLDNLYTMLQEEAPKFLGYPCSCEFDYSPLYRFLQYPVNNVGDPFDSNHYHLNSHPFEQEVVNSFIRFTNGNTEDIWGYVTNGGTEGNLYGAYLARELFPNGMVYYSSASHYSIPKILRIAATQSIMVKSQINGEIDYTDLYDMINVHRDVPPIIFANIGTTMTGAIDDITRIKQILSDLMIHEYYIHADAALSGMIIPFLKNPPAFGFDSGIDSLAISGHKMVGSPIPCGIALAKQDHVTRITRMIEYVGSRDTTITGSRNGVTPLFMWYAIQTKGMDGFRKMIAHSFKMADYAIEEFRKIDINAWRNENSITVVFPKQKKRYMEKWQMAVENDIAHIITMPHVTKEQIDLMIDDLR